ncbi:MAG: DUF1624 domain-containing protein, partial [Verrucomicrobia bacterium]|nr:DUF1624 domain-containing protein [Verrucomicrobiota bacterium]
WFNYVGVLYALGISMAVAGALSRWSSAALGILSLGLILLPEITAPVFRGRESSLPPAVALTILAGKSAGLNIYFPALPWLGLTTGGLLLGRLFLQRPRQAWRLAGSLGAGLTGAALLLRWNGGPGTLGVVEGRGWIGFLTFVKYSPSLAYVAWNAGLILVSLPVFNWVAQALPGWTRLGVIYGRSSLFFYVAHLVIYAGLSRILGPPGQGLPVVLLCWAAGLLILWPMCRWYFQFKRSTPLDSWWRLF